LEFAWQDEKEEDPAAQANNIKTLVSIGVMKVNEGRDQLGLDPVEGGDQCLVYTATGPVPLVGVTQRIQNPKDLTTEDTEGTEENKKKKPGAALRPQSPNYPITQLPDGAGAEKE
jgi:hypothetical protein